MVNTLFFAFFDVLHVGYIGFTLFLFRLDCDGILLKPPLLDNCFVIRNELNC